MGAWAAEVIEDGLLGAAGLFQRVGQDRKTGPVQLAAGEMALVVGCLCEG